MFWLLIWVVTHISLGFACFYLGYFAMVLLAMFTFPLLQTLVLILRFEKEKPGYWLLSYLPIVLSPRIIETISPIGIAIMYILFVEFILFLMSNKFGKFIFTTFSLFGLAIIYYFLETVFFQNTFSCSHNPTCSVVQHLNKLLRCLLLLQQ